MNPPVRNWRLNVRGALTLALGSVALVAALAGWTIWKGRSAAAALLRQSETQAKATPPRLDLALSYLNEYLAIRPDDTAALDRKSELLAQTAQTPDHLLAALDVGEQAIRLDPDGPKADATRKRIIELCLALARLLPADQQRLGTAEQIATRLTRNGTSQDAEALRLLARVLRARAAAGDAKALEGDADPDHPRLGALPILEKAQTLDPTDVAGAFELAQIERFDRNPPQPARAIAVLDSLLAAVESAEQPTPRRLGQARLARYRYFAQAAAAENAPAARASLRQKAAAELNAALAVSPDDLAVVLSAAEFAAAGGDIAAARNHLNHVPDAHREDLAVRLIQGLIERTANEPEAAIQAWREGLQAVGGTNADLTWRLAETLLQLGRLDEAEPLLRQHRRLTGGAEPVPSHRYLLGLRLLRLNRPVDALDELSKAQLRSFSDDAIQTQVLLALGQAYEALRSPNEALAQYDKAIRQAPRWPAPRLARARLLQQNRPDEAALELQAALADQPDEPLLLVALGRAQMAVQLRRPAAERRWDDLRQTLDRARQAGPETPGLALLEADMAALDGRLTDAVTRLRTAAEAEPVSVDLWTAYAAALLRQDQPEAALKVLEQASAPERAGDHAMLRVARARLLILLNRAQEARAVLVRNVESLPIDQQTTAWTELGSLLRQRREWDEARTAYEHAAALSPGDPQPQLVLLELDESLGDTASAQRRISALERLGSAGQLYARVARVQQQLRDPPPGSKESAADRATRLAQAEIGIEGIETAAPQQPFGPMLRGLLAERRGQPDDAIAAYELALDRGASPDVANHLVPLYARSGRLDRLSEVRRRWPEAGATLGRLATAELVARGRNIEAEQLAQRLAAGDPDSLDARIWEARVLNSVGKPADAEKTLRELADRSAEPTPWLTLLFFQISRKQPREALIATIGQIKTRVTQGVEVPELLWAQCYQAAGAIEAATATYNTALERWPDDPRIARAASGFFQNQGRIDRAEALLRAALKRDPAQRWAVRGLALLRSAQPDGWEEAWKLLGPAADGTESPEDRLTRAVVLARNPDPKRRAESATILEGLLADLPPESPAATAARDLLIHEAIRQGRPDRARQLATVAAAGTASPTAIAVLAELSIQAGRLDEAQRQIDRLAAAAPADRNGVKLRALLLKAQGQPEAAATLVEDAVSTLIDGNDGEAAVRDLISLFVPTSTPPSAPTPLADQTAAAERIARVLADHWPDSSWLLGRVLGASQPAAALDACRRVADTEGARAEDLVQAARLAADLGASAAAPQALKDRAGKVLETALKREPNSLPLLQIASYVWHAQGRYDDELAIYQRIEALKPVDLSHLNNLAWTLSENFRKPAEALPLIDRLLAKVGANPQCLDTRGMILVRLDRPKDAVAVFQKVVQAAPSNPVYQYHLARACLKAGDEAGFRTHRDRARDAGLTAEQLETSERAEFQQLMAR